jgi:carbonic anhydrase
MNISVGIGMKIRILLAIALMLSCLVIMGMATDGKSGITAEQAMKNLVEGNARFVSNQATHPNQAAKRRVEVVSGQHPFAIIVGCSDSRVPPEVLFDQGIGDLFVVRTAGQVMDDVTIGSIEYAVEHLNVPLIVVLGHDACGAVKATIEGGTAPGHLGSLVEFIKPAVDEAKASGNESQLLNSSIDINVRNIVNELSATKPILSSKIKEGKLKIVGARYLLNSGTVKFN